MDLPQTEHLSIDLWDTLLRRKCHPDEVKLYTAQRMLHLLDNYLVSDPPGTMELFRRRQRIEAAIGNRRIQEGFDDEYEIDEVLKQCVADAAGRSLGEDELEQIARDLVHGEIQQEIAVTYLDKDMINLLATCRFGKLHVISDFYMSADKVRKIIQAHSFPHPVENFFLSCDVKLNKRSGRLYQHVCSLLAVNPDEILHIGDNREVDFEMAVSRGLKAYHFRGSGGDAARRKNEEFFTLRKEVNIRADKLLLTGRECSASADQEKDSREEALRRFGRSMSPLFVGFSLYIQEICRLGGHSSAYFFTREGRFFQRVFDRVQKNRLYGLDQVASRLLPVSRLASFFPSLRKLDTEEMMRIWSQYHTQSVNSLLKSLGLEPGDYRDCIQKNGIDPDETISSPWQDEGMVRLFSDRAFLNRLSEEQRLTKKNLQLFFHECGFDSADKALIVDIGWRGTIQDNLALIFPEITIDGCYLGLQKFFNPQPPNTNKFGFIADENTNIHHVMLRYVMPIEMLCFSSGGSATGYRSESTGKVNAVFHRDNGEEWFYNEWMSHFQEGVLDGVENVCRKVAQHGISIRELQAEARFLAAQFINEPPLVMCRAFNAFKQDDTFGMARTIFPGDSSFRLRDRLLTYISKGHRERFLDDLEKSGWPQCLLRSRYFGVFHQVGNLRKRLIGLAGKSKP